jgi:hypothetical protein
MNDETLNFVEGLKIEGGSYTGYLKNEKRYGPGIFTYPEKARYEGMWVDDHAEGHGRF